MGIHHYRSTDSDDGLSAERLRQLQRLSHVDHRPLRTRPRRSTARQSMAAAFPAVTKPATNGDRWSLSPAGAGQPSGSPRRESPTGRFLWPFGAVLLSTGLRLTAQPSANGPRRRRRRNAISVQGMRSRLRHHLTIAIKARDRVAVAALRSAIAAIENAEAIQSKSSPNRETNSEHIAGATSGVGSSDVARRELTDADVAAIVREQIEERFQAADEYEQLGRRDAADRL